MATPTAPTPAPIQTPTNAPASVTTSGPTSDGGTSDATVIKPGATTSEFVVTMLIILGGLLMSTPLITSNTIINAIGLGVAFLKAAVYTWSRTQVKTAASAAASSLPMLAVLLFGLHSLTACTQLKAEGKVALDCAHADSAKSAISEYGPLAASVALNAVNGDGTIAKDQLLNAFSNLVSDAGKCVALDAVAKLSTLKKPGAGAAASSALVADPASVADALSALKTQLAPGREVKL